MSLFSSYLLSPSSLILLSDAAYFRHPTRPAAPPTENWVLRFSGLKRLYRLMTQYIANVLQKPTNSLDVPDLQAIARDFDLRATLAMCRLLIVIGVQCEENKAFIDKIRELEEGHQHLIMKAIEQVSCPDCNILPLTDVCRLWQKFHSHQVYRKP